MFRPFYLSYTNLKSCEESNYFVAIVYVNGIIKKTKCCYIDAFKVSEY